MDYQKKLVYRHLAEHLSKHNGQFETMNPIGPFLITSVKVEGDLSTPESLAEKEFMYGFMTFSSTVKFEDQDFKVHLSYNLDSNEATDVLDVSRSDSNSLRSYIDATKDYDEYIDESYWELIDHLAVYYYPSAKMYFMGKYGGIANKLLFKFKIDNQQS